jgi:hypothetical protein
MILEDPTAFFKYLKTKGRDTRFTDYAEIKEILDEAKKDLLEHGTFSEITESIGPDTLVIIIERKTWEKWFGDKKH